MSKHEKINYLEFPAKDINATKSFFKNVFSWEFVDYGPEYISFSNAGIDGGFFKANLFANTDAGSVLVVLYSENLENTRDKISKHGGKIKKDIFSFPGGRRFHFTDPNNNEFAVWSE